jgi:ABC-type polysaccharide/polyol phosphate export permease
VINDTGRFVIFLLQYRELIINFVRRDLVQRYVGSLLGIYWSLLNPIITLVIYVIVFGVFLKVRLPGSESVWDFSLYFAAGFLPWLAFQSSLMRASTAIIENKGYIKKVPFPSLIFPLYITLSESVNLLIGIALYFLFYFILKGIPGISIILLPLIIVIQIILTLAFSFILSAATVFFRDIPQILSSFFLIWFWGTPIVYTVDVIPPEFLWIIHCNPIFYLIELYRGVLLYGIFPDPLLTGIMILLILVFFVISLSIFKATSRGFGELL